MNSCWLMPRRGSQLMRTVDRKTSPRNGMRLTLLADARRGGRRRYRMNPADNAMRCWSFLASKQTQKVDVGCEQKATFAPVVAARQIAEIPAHRTEGIGSSTTPAPTPGASSARG